MSVVEGLNTREFFSRCTQDIHEAARKEGQAKDGVILIYELMRYSEYGIDAFFNNQALAREFYDDLYSYFFLIMMMSLQYGLVLARQWKVDFNQLTEEYVNDTIDFALTERSEVVYKEIGLADEQKRDDFLGKIYDIVFEWIRAYVGTPEQPEYITKAMVAAYQLGISMAIAKSGMNGTMGTKVDTEKLFGLLKQYTREGEKKS